MTQQSRVSRPGTIGVVAIILALLGAALSSGGCSGGQSASDGVTATSAKAVHGQFADPLDSAGAESVSLDAALKQIERDVLLPDAALTGEPVRALVDDWDGKSPEEYGLAVLYASGLKLTVQPGETDLKATANEGNAATFSDGSRSHYRMTSIDDHGVLAVTGGVQQVGTGGYDVPNIVAWNDSGFTYRLEAEPGVLSVDDLLGIAESMR